MPWGSQAGRKEGQFDLDELFRVSGLFGDEFSWGLVTLGGMLSGDTNCSSTQLAVTKRKNPVCQKTLRLSQCHDEAQRVKMHARGVT